MNSPRSLVAAMLTTLLGGACAHQPAQAPQGSRPREAVEDLINFENLALPCARAGEALQNFCMATKPSPWTAPEENAVRALVADLARNDRNRALLKAAVFAGYRTVYKFNRGFMTNDGRYFESRMRAMAWLGAPANGVGFNQRFLDVELGADPISGFDLKQQALLHELFHAVDRQESYSTQYEFIQAYDATLKGVDGEHCERIRETLLKNSERGQDRPAWIQMRTDVQKVRIPAARTGQFLPTVTVCLNGSDKYVEAFAEFASFWYLDRTAKTYFPSPIAEWLTQAFP